MNYSSLQENKKRGTFDFPIELYQVDSLFPRYQMPFHWHLEYELILIKSGSFDLSLDGKIFSMHAGDCAWVSSGIVHGGSPRDSTYQCIVFDLRALLHDTPICAKSAAEFIADENAFTGVFPAGSRQAKISSHMFLAMEQGQRGYEWTTVGLMWQLMGSLVHDKVSSPPSFSRSRHKILQFKNVLAYIKEHYQEEITLCKLASLAGMSPKYFCRAFSQMTGKTPIEYLNYYRIEQAGEQLIFTEHSVTEIALDCGFHDMSYFSKIFSKYKGISPTAYRKREQAANNSSL